jgi:hypothetical protein
VEGAVGDRIRVVPDGCTDLIDAGSASTTEGSGEREARASRKARPALLARLLAPNARMRANSQSAEGALLLRQYGFASLHDRLLHPVG